MLFSPQRQLTFASFEIRPGSVRARAAAGAMAISPTIGCAGPLLILAGRSGCGKTHLLHASANLARQRHDSEWRSSTLSAWRLAEEVQRCLHHGDLPLWLNRFASDHYLAIDDVSDIAQHSAAADFVLKLLQLRSHARRKTLLTARLTVLSEPDSPLTTFLNQQTAIRLD